MMCTAWQANVTAAAAQLLLVRERSALSDPYCHLAWMSICMYVCMYVHNIEIFEVKYLENERS